jgi:two-component system, cell cycle response regulator DivK
MATTKKVLIAEDSSVIQNLTKKILQIENYEISTVKNGQQVIEMLEKGDFDIILMDINMPKMDGLECAKNIRALGDAKKSQVPIVAITGNARNMTLEEFREHGINEFLPKPLDFDSLVATVKKYTT